VSSSRVPPVVAPWPYWTAKAAAKHLGVGVELINGLASQKHPQLRSVETRGASGAVVWLVNRADAKALGEVIGRG
jgi:ABC-type sugar transport system substrate-binding protein